MKKGVLYHPQYQALNKMSITFKELLDIYNNYFQDLPNLFCVYLTLFNIDRLVLRKLISRFRFHNINMLNLLEEDTILGSSVREENNKLTHDINLLRYVQIKWLDPREKTEELCKISIEIYAPNLCHIEEQTEEMCKCAVAKAGMVLEYAKIRTYEICKLAVKQNALAIQFVDQSSTNLTEEQIEELCELALRENYSAIKFIKRPSKKICILSVCQNGWILSQKSKIWWGTEFYLYLCRIGLNMRGLDLQYIKYFEVDNMTNYVELCKIAVQKDGLALQYVAIDKVKQFDVKEYKEICKLAIASNADAYFLINDTRDLN